MSYLKYANTCAEVLRGVLKDGARQRAKAREAVYFRQAAWKDGKPQAQGTMCINVYGFEGEINLGEKCRIPLLGPCPAALTFTLFSVVAVITDMLENLKPK